MIPAYDFALKCSNPVFPEAMSGQPLDTLVFEYASGEIAYISYVGFGRAGGFARTLASAQDGLRVEIDTGILIATSGTGRLKQLSFDSATGILAGEWRAGTRAFGGACAMILLPLHQVRIPDRGHPPVHAPQPVTARRDPAERQAELLKRAEAERREANRRAEDRGR